MLLIGPASEIPPRASPVPMRVRINQLMTEEGLNEKSALKKVAKERGISKSEAYREFQRERR